MGRRERLFLSTKAFPCEAFTRKNLAEVRYQGAFCVEYVPMEQWRCDEMDVLTAVVETRSAFEAHFGPRH